MCGCTLVYICIDTPMSGIIKRYRVHKFDFAGPKSSFRMKTELILLFILLSTLSFMSTEVASQRATGSHIRTKRDNVNTLNRLKRIGGKLLQKLDSLNSRINRTNLCKINIIFEEES